MPGLGGALATAERLRRELGIGGTLRILARKLARRLRHERPPNTTDANREVWTTHDWSERGDEWTPSPEWKAAVVRELLEPFVPRGARVLEIGPGGGRWTEFLVERAGRLTLVDVTPACIELCRARFRGHDNIDYHVNDGTDLSFVGPGTVDAIWSFDVFVHIASADVERYVRQFAEVLCPGGVAVIHHARSGVYRPSWRSDMTAEHMVRMCAQYGLEVVSQVDSLEDGRMNIYAAGGDVRPDVVTVLRRPPVAR